jgi:NAD(P)-dependent dehydrogenase (short-subunit alcohol dehydrogenase family)/acyl carrier protein
MDGHPLLGKKTFSSLSENEMFWTSEISSRSVGFIDDHRVRGETVFPAAGYIEMVIKAATSELGGTVELVDMEICEALLCSNGERVTLQVAFRREGQNAMFQVASVRNGDENNRWTVHARGRVRSVDESNDIANLRANAELRQRVETEGWERFDGEEFYRHVAAVGLEFGDTFRGVRRGWRRTDEALVELGFVGEVAKGSNLYGIHPALLDAALQASAAAIGQQEDALFLPVGIESVRLQRPANGWLKCEGLLSYARCVREGNNIRSDITLLSSSGEPLAQISGLRSRRVKTEDPSLRWTYEIGWQFADDSTDLASNHVVQSWIVFSDSSGISRKLEQAVAAQDRSILLVRRASVGSPFRMNLLAGEVYIDPTQPEHYLRLLRELPSSFGGNGFAILHAWSLDDLLEEDTCTVEMGLGWSSLLQLVHAVESSSLGSRPRFVVLTAGARSVLPSDRLCGVLQSPVVGLCKTLVQEHPDLACQCIDVQESRETLDDSDVKILVRELLTHRDEDELAVRSGRLYVPRLTRVRLQSDDGVDGQTSFTVDSEGIHLITGGLGGLGLSLAKWLVGRGARHLVLLGRSTPSTASLDTIAVMREEGAEVTLLKVDVSRADELNRELTRITANGRPIRSVFHLAGVLDNAVLSALSVKRFAQVLEPKVQGTWNLHRATRGQPLDHFVLFSSVASAFGAAGQGNHAAANAFLDGFAAYRASRGEKGLAVNWGAWAEVGEAAKERAASFVASRGLSAMSPQQALEVLGCAINTKNSQLVVVAFDRSAIAETGLVDRPLFSRLMTELDTRSRMATSGDNLTREALIATTPSDRQRRVANYLRTLLAAQTGFSPSQLDIHRPLNRLGIDSLMTLRLKNRIERSLGVSVPVTMLMQGSTTVQLAARIAELVCGEGESESSTYKTRPPAASTQVSTLQPPPSSTPATRAAQRRAARARQSETE